MVNFVLEALEATVTMSEIGEIEAGTPPPTLTTDAEVTIPVASATFRNIFRFQSDSVDFVDDEATDIKYYVHPSFWTAIQPATGVVSTTDAVGGIVGATLAQDFVRHIALELFNTHHAVDLFTNEATLISDLGTQCATVNSFIEGKLNESNSDAASKPDGMFGDAAPWHRKRDDLSNKNFSRTLFKQLLSVEPERLGDFDTDVDLSAIHPIPFKSGDSISFKLIINAADHSEIFGEVDNAPSVDPRSYKVILNMTS
jgi:hypothetical protein